MNSSARAYSAAAVSVIGFGCVPVVIQISGASIGPFMFNAATTATQAIVLTFFLISTAHKSLISFEWRWAMSAIFTTSMPWLIVSRLDYGFFAWSARHVDIAVTAALFRLWPLVMVIILAAYASRRGTPAGISSESVRTLDKRSGVWMAIAAVGASTTALSQLDSEFGTSAQVLLVGSILAVIACILAGVSPAASIIFSNQVYRSNSGDSESCAPMQHMWLAIAGYGVSACVAVPMNIIVALLTHESIAIDQRAGAGAVAWAF